MVISAQLAARRAKSIRQGTNVKRADASDLEVRKQQSIAAGTNVKKQPVSVIKKGASKSGNGYVASTSSGTQGSGAKKEALRAEKQAFETRKMLRGRNLAKELTPKQIAAGETVSDYDKALNRFSNTTSDQARAERGIVAATGLPDPNAPALGKVSSGAAGQGRTAEGSATKGVAMREGPGGNAAINDGAAQGLPSELTDRANASIAAGTVNPNAPLFQEDQFGSSLEEKVVTQATEQAAQDTGVDPFAITGEQLTEGEYAKLKAFAIANGVDPSVFPASVEEYVQRGTEASAAQLASATRSSDVAGQIEVMDNIAAGSSARSSAAATEAALAPGREGAVGAGRLGTIADLRASTDRLIQRNSMVLQEQTIQRDEALKALQEAKRNNDAGLIENAQTMLANAEFEIAKAETDYINALTASANTFATAQEADAFDKELTELINDGFLYSMQNGIPTKVTDAQGSPVTVGVAPADTNLKFTPPQIDSFGNIVTPGYIFDANSGELSIATGTGETIATGYDAIVVDQAFSNFDSYVKSVGSGQLVNGSPYHAGFEVDIDGEIGDPLLGFIGGTVTEATNTCPTDKNDPNFKTCNGGFGNSIVVKDSKGNSIRYAHMNSVNVTNGQTVSGGSLIGTMGNTGQTIAANGGDGSHLHIEARNSAGQLVDLSSLDTSSMLSLPQGTSVNQLRADAFEKGYLSDSEVIGYINAVQNGVIPPDRTEIEMSDSEFDKANTLRDEFQGLDIVKDFKEIQDKAALVKSIVESGVSGPGDLALVFAFMKSLDPTSVVRESEYDSAADSGSIFAGIFAKFNGQFSKGQILPQSVRDEFLGLVQQQLEVKNNSFQTDLDFYTDLANKSGVDIDFVVRDYSEGIGGILGSDPTYDVTSSAQQDIDNGLYTLEQLRAAIKNDYEGAVASGLITPQ
jgi:murein DD-endopeptidase MepM/ murein hydrolase activator NlpD